MECGKSTILWSRGQQVIKSHFVCVASYKNKKEEEICDICQFSCCFYECGIWNETYSGMKIIL